MLWDKIKHLKSLCPIYLESMTEDANSAPKEYVVVEQSTYDEGYAYGDGRTFMRRKTFNIRIYTKTPQKASSVLTAYVGVLDTHNIKYTYFGPTQDSVAGNYASLIQGSYTYGKST